MNVNPSPSFVTPAVAEIRLQSAEMRASLLKIELRPPEQRTGHLSNEDVATWLRDDFDGSARYLVLAHLSQRANNPYLAKINAEVALQERAPLFYGFTEIHLSYPKDPTPWIEV